MRPDDHTALSEKERQAVEQVAAQRGITFEEAVEQMAKEGLASRVRRKTGRAPAKVYDMNRRRQ
jgi:predicted kinase